VSNREHVEVLVSLATRKAGGRYAADPSLRLPAPACPVPPHFLRRNVRLDG